jgi:hypothetical protein
VSEQEAEKPGGLKINDKWYEFPKDFKVGELRALKRFTGKTIDEIDWSDPEAIAAVVFILKRRENSAFTEEELDDCTISFPDEEEESPPAVAALPTPPKTPPPTTLASGAQS